MADVRNTSTQPLINISDLGREESYSSDDDSSNTNSPYHSNTRDDERRENPSSLRIPALGGGGIDRLSVQLEDVKNSPPLGGIKKRHSRLSSLSPKVTRSDSVKLSRQSNGGAGRKSSVPGGAQTPNLSKPSRRVPSLKLKRMNQGATTTTTDNQADSNMPCLSKCKNRPNNPSITITIDSDDDSIYSDYLSPDMNYKGNDIKVHFVGDETSLYGTPKEELLPSQDNISQDQQKSSPTNFLKGQFISFFQPSDNKLAMKLFGNRRSLLREKIRHKRQGNWVIHPCSNFR